MTNNVYATVRDCHSRAQNRLHGKKQREQEVFFPDGPIEYVGMDIVQHLPETSTQSIRPRCKRPVQEADVGHVDSKD